MALRKVTYRLYPSRTQATALAALLDHHRQLYNACLQQRIEAWSRRRKGLGYAQQCAELAALRRECPEWTAANCSSQQITLRRLDKAFSAFFRRIKAGQTPGFPRFKSLRRFPGFGFKSHGDGWRFTPGAEWTHGKLRLQGVGTIKARGRARQGGTIKSCELMHRDGAWHLSLTVTCPVIERQGGTSACGLDWGVESFATLAVADPNGGEPTMEVIANPRWFRAERAKLLELEQAKDRKRHRSNRRRKAARRVAAAKARAARRRKDWQHKLSARLVGRFALVATEQLAIQNMTRSAKGTTEAPGKHVRQKAGLNREILDTAPAQFLSFVAYKAEEAGTLLLTAPTRSLKPSQSCPACGVVRKKTLGERVHRCADCGDSRPRDFASACVVLRWAEHQLLNGQELADAA
jgi:putative transposase